MDALYEDGLRFIVALQTVGWLETPMRFFSFLGTQEFFTFVLPAVYWCIDAGIGIRIGFVLLIGNSLSGVIKMALHEPRPYWVSAQVKALTAESNFGVPSGHALMAAGIWGTIANGIRRPWAWITAAVLVFLIGLSRIYLGVHFPQDTIVGWVFGGLILWVFLAIWAPATAWLRRQSLSQQLLLSLFGTALLLGLGAILALANTGYVVPQEWMVNAARAGEPLPAPFALDGILSSTGTLLGFSVGLALLQRWGGHKPSGSALKRIVSFAVGLAGVLILYLGLKAVLPQDASLWSSSLRVLRYALLGAWVAAGAPWLFIRLRLMQKANSGAVAPPA